MASHRSYGSLPCVCRVADRCSPATGFLMARLSAKYPPIQLEEAAVRRPAVSRDVLGCRFLLKINRAVASAWMKH